MFKGTSNLLRKWLYMVWTLPAAVVRQGEGGSLPDTVHSHRNDVWRECHGALIQSQQRVSLPRHRRSD